MKQKASKTGTRITEAFIDEITERLGQGLRVRRELPYGGRLHVDRQLPFLCIYRRPVDRADTGTDRLVVGEAAYLIADARPRLRPDLRKLVRSVARVMTEAFGGFILVEVWSTPDAGPPAEHNPVAQYRPGFEVSLPTGDRLLNLSNTLVSALGRIKVQRQPAEISVHRTGRFGPPDMPPLFSLKEAREMNCVLLGLAARPIYRNGCEGEVYPQLLRRLQRGVSGSLRRAFHEFAVTRTTQRPVHYHALGRRAVVKAVWDVDRRLSEVGDSFDFVLLINPINAEEAWRDFLRNRFQKDPVFHYQPLPIDPVLLKRKLYQTPAERVEDPALSLLLRQKLYELDRQITMLMDINTPRFIHSSVQMFGGVDDDLLAIARRILDRLPSRTRDDTRQGTMPVAEFVRRSEEEIAYLRGVWPEVDARVHVRADIGRGLMVSSGSLLVGHRTTIPKTRAEALIQHEVGTHVLTYYNGRSQPFRLLSTGLAGYEPLQEGLAVLAEYLVGGLSRPRLRLIAARVVAVRNMVDGASFVETFRELDRNYDFERRTAFTIARRVYRGGGFTKDAAYLRGLLIVLDHLREGGDIEPLFAGKFAADHIPIMRELQLRQVLRPAPLTPRYLATESAQARLAALKRGVDILDLAGRK